MTARATPSLTRHDDLASRINARLLRDGSVVIPPRIAKWLDRQAGMTPERRALLRGTDIEAYEALVALHLSALGSVCGTNHAAAQANPPEWWSTTEAAKALGVSDRSIRKRCENGRLAAELVGGRWLIHRNTLAATRVHEGRNDVA